MNTATRRDARFFPGHRLHRRLQCRLQHQLRPLALAAASLFALAPASAAGPALPSGLNVVQGQASTALNGNRLTVTNSAGALLDWQQFNIGAGAAVHFAQPSAASKVLNRVVGNDPSNILGSLSSNGQVWLQNPNGVLFGQGARIDVASLVATTLAIDAGAWQDGLRTGSFRLGDAAAAGLGGIVNQGELRSASGGQVLLVGGAGGVQNTGLIQAPDGQVLLAAGAQVDLVDTSQPRVGLRLQAPQGEVLNLGQVLVGSGRVDLQAAMVNQQGIVRADSIGAGGAVLASASEALTLGAGSVTSASGATGGQVALDAGSGTLLVAGRIDATASAGGGGQVSLLGRQVGLVDGGAIDASGFAGGGAVRLGGGLRGQDPAYRNAEATFMGRGASIHADATGRGDGGLVVLWGSQAMRAYGTLSARGGALGGDGGFIETSGGWIDARPSAISTQAPAGRAGQWLLDPDDIQITDNVSEEFNISTGPDFTSTGSPSWLSTGTLAAALNAGNDVSVTTSVDSFNSTGYGDITMSAANLLVAPPKAVTLTFNAVGNIEFADAVIRSGASPLTVRLRAGAAGGQLNYSSDSAYGGGIHLVRTDISTAGGDIDLGGPTLACGLNRQCSATGSAAVHHMSRLTKAIELTSSNLDAGTGNVVMRGTSLVLGGNSTAVELTDSTVRARMIDIVGLVDTYGPLSGYGVLISGGELTATDALTVRGELVSQVAGSETSQIGLQISNAAQLATLGDASTMNLQGLASIAQGSGGGQAIGLDINGEGTLLLAAPGGVIDLVGQAGGGGLNQGIRTSSPDLATIDASAGSRLTLTGFGEMRLGAGMVAPTGGSLGIHGGADLFSANWDVFIDGMRLTGAPSEARISGSVVAIGTSGLSTAVSFEAGTALVTVHANQFLLGVEQGSVTGASAGQKQALNFAPPTEAQALLAADGSIGIYANSVRLGNNAVVYSSGLDAAIFIAGRDCCTSVQTFNNLGGANALQVEPGHRWLVHATDSADLNTGFQPGGLQADFWQYGATPFATAPAQGGNGFLFASTPVLSLAGSGALVKTYDGTTAADLGSANLSVSGLRSGQTFVGSLSFADANAGTAKPLALSSGANASSVLTSDQIPVYGYALDSASLRGTINPRPLTLQSVTLADKVYDGSLAATVNNWNLGNVVGADDVRLAAVTATFSAADAGSARPAVAQAGSLTGTAAANYSAAGLTAPTTGNILPRPLTLQAVTLADKVYDGTVAATVNNWRLGNVVGEDDVSLAGVTAMFSAPGAGSARPAVALAGSLTGESAANYSAEGLTASTTGNILPRPLTLQSVTVADKVYDGRTAATVTAWRLAGVVEGDSVQVKTGSATFASPDVSTSRPVTATVATLGGTAAANYSASGASAQSLAAITPATLTYVANALTLPVGTALPTLTGTVTGFVGEDSLSYATSGTLRFYTELPLVPVPGRYGIGGTGLSASNYRFVQAPANATALTLTTGELAPETIVPGSVITSSDKALVAVLPPTLASTPAIGRALDAVPMLAPTPAARGQVSIWGFDSLDLDHMSADTIAMALAARDAYKNEVFKAAKEQLAANPAAADARGCASQQQAASGECLLLQPVASSLDISNARVVERLQGAVPAPAQPPAAAAPAPAQPVAAAPAPTPAAPVVAPAPAVAAAPAAPALPVIRVQPLPPDLSVNLPRRQAVARAAVPQIQRKIAVLIGIDRYQDGRIPQLGNAVSDAQAVARTLTERLGYETVVLENPGKATIFRTLNQLAGQVGPNDSVVLYYAGHGERIEKTGLGYWQPADADASRAETWISNADIDRLLRTLPASQLAMVSDSCFSGSLVSGERIRGVPATPDPAALLSKRAVVVMTSGGNEPVFDSGLNNHSPFAWNLMQSLNQVGNQAIGWRPGSNVFEQVRFAVARKLPQRPQYGASSGGGHEQGADYLFEQRQLR